MSTFIVGNDNNNAQQFEETFEHAQAGDTIELLPGDYFKANSFEYFEINKDIVITGTSTDNHETRINCSFIIGNQATVILKNLTLNYSGSDDNTLAAFNHSQVYGQNICVKRLATDKWDTIYIKDSAISLTNSQIMTNGDKNQAIGLFLENSQLLATDSTIERFLQKNSTSYLKNIHVVHFVGSKNHSQLDFVNLSIAGVHNPKKSNFYTVEQSQVKGQQLQILNQAPIVDVSNSAFTVTDVSPDVNNFNFRFDEKSNVTIDNVIPPTDGPFDFDDGDPSK